MGAPQSRARRQAAAAGILAVLLCGLSATTALSQGDLGGGPIILPPGGIQFPTDRGPRDVTRLPKKAKQAAGKAVTGLQAGQPDAAEPGDNVASGAVLIPANGTPQARSIFTTSGGAGNEGKDVDWFRF